MNERIFRNIKRREGNISPKLYMKTIEKKEVLSYVLIFGIFASIFLCVPQASGDDWTFGHWYPGLTGFIKYMFNHYKTFNGRPFLYYSFALTSYYFDAWWFFATISVLLFIITTKRILGISGWKNNFFITGMLLLFSWEMNRQIYLYPVGNTAYFINFALIFLLITIFFESKETYINSILLAIGFFFVTLGNENFAFALCGMFFLNTFINFFVNKKFSFRNTLVTISVICSGLLCVFNPAGQRFEEAMSKVNISYSEMIVKNIHTIINYLYEQNSFIFIVYLCLCIAIFKDKQVVYKYKKIQFGGVIVLIQILELLVLIFHVVGKYFNYQYSNLIFHSGISVVIWVIVTFLHVIPVLAYCCSNRKKQIAICLSVLAYASAGIMILLPEVSHRTMFYALMVIIIISAWFFSNLQIPKWICVLLFCTILISFDNFMYKLVPIKKVTDERLEIIEQYKKDRAIYGDRTNTIVLPAYPENTVSFSNDNCNPKIDTNPYAYQAFKSHYGIPTNVDLLIDDGFLVKDIVVTSISEQEQSISIVYESGFEQCHSVEEYTYSVTLSVDEIPVWCMEFADEKSLKIDYPYPGTYNLWVDVIKKDTGARKRIESTITIE